jgi:hypothetical protein
MSETTGSEDRRPDDIIRDASEAFQDKSLGAMTLRGRLGYHTLYNHGADDPTMAFDTALVWALDDLFDELWMDEDIVRDRQSEATPEAIAEETVEQVHEFTGIRFDQWTEEQFKDSLAEKLRKLNGAGGAD